MRTEIATFGALVRTAWDQYKQRALPLLAVMLISAVVVGGLMLVLILCATIGWAMLTHFTDERTAIYLVILLVCILLLVVTVLLFWSQTSLLALVVNENLGIIEAFQAGWTFLWPMAWVLTLFSGIVLTGFVLGFLPGIRILVRMWPMAWVLNIDFFIMIAIISLSSVPGILFLVWFTFCMYVLLEEDRRGMDTLLASKEYVRGHWWNTFGKLLPLLLISAIAGRIPFIGQVFSLLFAPFSMLFMLAMYRNFKTVKGVAEIEAGSGGRIFWWTMAVLGLALSLVAAGAVLFSLLTASPEWLPFPVPGPMHDKWL